jgi:hypothetical protein
VEEGAELDWRDMLDWGDAPQPDAEPVIAQPEAPLATPDEAPQSVTGQASDADDAIFAALAGDGEPSEGSDAGDDRCEVQPSGLKELEGGLIAKADPVHWWKRRPAWRGFTGACLVAVLGVGVLIGITQARSQSRPSLAGFSAGQVINASISAVRQVGSFEFDANGLSTNKNVALAVNLERDGALISEAVGNLRISLAVRRGAVFVRAGRTFWSEFLGVDAGRARVLDRWIGVPASSPEVGTISRVLSFDAAIASLLDLRRPVLAPSLGSLLGAPIFLRGTLPNTAFNAGAGGGETALLEVSSVAPFYPIQLTVRTLTGTATYHFKEWGWTWKLPSMSSVVSLSTVESQLRVSAPTAPLLPTAPTPTGTAPRGSVPTVTASPSIRGVSVDVPEATSVASHLWQGLVAARHYRDPGALARVESGTALLVDRAICLAGCPPPPLLTMTGLTIVVPHQTSWPADFLATAEYSWDCPEHPCDDTFVAVQPRRGAPWKINLIVTYSGPAPVPPSDQTFTGYVTAPALAHHPVAYLQQYAEYLDSVVMRDESPPSTWLQPGPFTTGFGNLYEAPLVQQEGGYTDRVQYGPGTSPTFTFFASGQPIVCGSVYYVDTETALRGRVLVQPPDRANFGPTLAPGVYHQVVSRGLHMNCYIYQPSVPDHVFVMGDWRGRVSASGTAAGSPRLAGAFRTIPTTSSSAPQ